MGTPRAAYQATHESAANRDHHAKDPQRQPGSAALHRASTGDGEKLSALARLRGGQS